MKATTFGLASGALLALTVAWHASPARGAVPEAPKLSREAPAPTAASAAGAQQSAAGAPASAPGTPESALSTVVRPTTMPAASPIAGRTRIEGFWVWQPIYVADAGERQKLLDFCTRQGFNRLLVQVPWMKGTAQQVNHQHLDTTPPGSAMQPQIDHAAEFAQLIADAAARHIAVEALDGTPYMGDKDHQAESLATVDAILAFNNTLPAGARFVGIHWDIEPYVRADWKVPVTRPQIEMDYLDLLSQAQKKLHDANANMTLAVDIPMWYDNKTDPDDNCIISWNGQTKNLYEHIEDVCDYVGIMSYRQHALGRNSTSEQIANEMAYAEKIGKFVCPAFETIQLKDTPQITFFGKSADDLQGERHKLEDSLKDRPGFGGMFIHNYPTITVIVEPPAAAK